MFSSCSERSQRHLGQQLGDKYIGKNKKVQAYIAADIQKHIDEQNSKINSAKASSGIMGMVGSVEDSDEAEDEDGDGDDDPNGEDDPRPTLDGDGDGGIVSPHRQAVVKSWLPTLWQGRSLPRPWCCGASPGKPLSSARACRP